MDVLFEPVWPWPVVVAVALLLVGSTIWAYTRRHPQLPLGKRRLLMSLRLLAAAALIFAMFRPVVQFSETTAAEVELLVALDSSRSMSVKDGPGGAERFAEARKFVSEIPESLGGDGKSKAKIRVRKFAFDQTFRPFDAAVQEPKGDFSAIGAALDELLREGRQTRILGVVLATDGRHQAVAPFDADPRSVARRLAEAQMPIYPVAFGSSTSDGQSLDLAMEEMVVDPVVFERKTTPVTGRLRVVGQVKQPVTVRVLVEDRSGKRLGESGPLLVAPASGQSRPVRQYDGSRGGAMPVELSFVPQSAGEIKIALEAVPLTDEAVTRNNRLERVISVRTGGLRVAYFDAPRVEAKFVNMINGSAQIQVDFQEIRGGAGKQHTKIDPSWFLPGRYDVYLIGNVPADAFTPQHLAQLTSRVHDGAGLLMTGGLRNFASGGYGTTPLADCLPVALDGKESTQIPPPALMIPTDLGLRRYVMQLDSTEKNRERWAELPALEGAVRLAPKHPLVEVWATTADQAPLLLAAEVGKARVAAFGGDTTWRWVTRGRAAEHQRFWRQLILWLARKDQATDEQLWVRVDPRNYPPGAPVAIEFGARTPQGDPVRNATLAAEVVDPNGKSWPLAPRVQGDHFAATFTETLPAGDYWVRVSSKQQPAGPGAFDAFTRFVVDARDLELDDPSADRALLDELAQLTGGRSIVPEESATLLKSFAETTFPDLTQIRQITLWDQWWVLGVFAVFLSLEWALRQTSNLA